MLFILDQEVKFSPQLHPACLPFNEYSLGYPSLGKTYLIAGWGRTNGTDPYSSSNDLQNALNTVVDCKTWVDKLCSCSYTNLNTSIFCSSKWNFVSGCVRAVFPVHFSSLLWFIVRTRLSCSFVYLEQWTINE
jgi:hypothetical protein